MSRVDRHCIRALVLLVLLAVPLPVARAASGPFTDLPARERSLSDGTPQALSHAYGTAVHGDDAGHVAVLNLQDFTLRALYSADGGITFAPEVVVAGGPERPIRDFTSTAASDGTVAVELAIGDPEGNIGISVVVSHDAGRTWSAPVSVVKHGDPNMGVMARRDLMSISVGAGGRMALFFANEAYRMYRVATSVDGGATWGAPVRVDTVTGYPSAFTPSTALAVDGSGRVHVAWLQPSGSGTRVAWYARSTDAGASYSAPLNLSATAHPSSTRTAYWVTLAGTNDGALLAAIAESQVSVVRSIDGGATFTTTYNASQGTSVRRVAIATASAHSTVLVLTQDQTASPGTAGQVRAMRSTDQGATWGTPSVVAPAARLNAFAADAVGNAGWALAWTDTGDNVTRIPNATWASTSADDGATWSTAQRADDVPAAPGFTTLARNGLSRAGAARFVLAYTDGRAALNRSQEVRTNGSALTPVSFGPDASAPFARVAVNPYAATPSVATGDVRSRRHCAFRTASPATCISITRGSMSAPTERCTWSTAARRSAAPPSCSSGVRPIMARRGPRRARPWDPAFSGMRTRCRSLTARGPSTSRGPIRRASTSPAPPMAG